MYSRASDVSSRGGYIIYCTKYSTLLVGRCLSCQCADSAKDTKCAKRRLNVHKRKYYFNLYLCITVIAKLNNEKSSWLKLYNFKVFM